MYRGHHEIMYGIFLLVNVNSTYTCQLVVPKYTKGKKEIHDKIRQTTSGLDNFTVTFVQCSFKIFLF